MSTEVMGKVPLLFCSGWGAAVDRIRQNGTRVVQCQSLCSSPLHWRSPAGPREPSLPSLLVASSLPTSALGKQGKMGQEIIKKALKREARIAYDPETSGRLIHNTCSQMDASSRRPGNPPSRAPTQPPPRWGRIVIAHKPQVVVLLWP